MSLSRISIIGIIFFNIITKLVAEEIYNPPFKLFHIMQSLSEPSILRRMQESNTGGMTSVAIANHENSFVHIPIAKRDAIREIMTDSSAVDTIQRYDKKSLPYTTQQLIAFAQSRNRRSSEAQPRYLEVHSDKLSQVIMLMKEATTDAIDNSNGFDRLQVLQFLAPGVAHFENIIVRLSRSLGKCDFIQSER